ncbi:winged helix DNA-binding protein [Bacillus sp. FJAT-28004]|uniref:winged helix DNA-binding protein n=1 Tax=Bacillus sp. FJAT-28004 TaxID=1679165 RepID=UPI0006B560C2|nr:winged helix DNA-binding protein [Bacillus sp. FJAT-28004]
MSIKRTNSNVEQALLITEMMNQIGALQNRFQTEGEDEERCWMTARTSDDRVIDFLKEATVLMLHIVHAIGESELVNGITISKRFGIPRGSVSKITRRLLEQGIVQGESLPDNKKEVLFRLTSVGQKVFDLHNELHVHIEGNVREFLSRYDIEQMQFLVQCMKDTVVTSWVRFDEAEDLQEDNSETEASRNFRDAGEVSEILAMLRRLDPNKLRKAKELIRIAFLED